MTQGLERALNNMKTRAESGKDIIYVKDNNVLYTTFFNVDVSNQSDILCPLYCLNHVYEVLSERNNQELDTNKIVISLNLARDVYYTNEFKTIDSALKNVFDRIDISLGICKSTIKGETFYGCRNLLLDDNFDILFMPCVKMDFTNRVFKDYILVIDYTLLDNPASIVGKAIMKKLIPYYLTCPFAYCIHDMVVNKTPSVFFTNMRGINSTVSTKIVETQPYSILNAELNNLINSIDYAS